MQLIVDRQIPACAAAAQQPTARILTARHGAIALFAIGMLSPVCWIALNWVSLTAFYEESIGYRYFYTLRQLHEPAYLFLPQGQSVNLIFKSVHVLLDILGFASTQVRPRIDYFSIISISTFQLLNVAAFAFLLLQSPRKSVLGCAILASARLCARPLHRLHPAHAGLPCG
jgi:hypothetical protein